MAKLKLKPQCCCPDDGGGPVCPGGCPTCADCEAAINTVRMVLSGNTNIVGAGDCTTYYGSAFNGSYTMTRANGFCVDFAPRLLESTTYMNGGDTIVCRRYFSRACATFSCSGSDFTVSGELTGFTVTKSTNGGGEVDGEGSCVLDCDSGNSLPPVATQGGIGPWEEVCNNGASVTGTNDFPDALSGPGALSSHTVTATYTVSA